MADNLVDLPSVPDSTDATLKPFLQKLREAVQILRGNRGDPMNAAITRADAVDLGLASVKYVRGGSTGVLVPSGGSGTGGTADEAGSLIPDLTPPPTVAGLTATAAISHVLVQFTAPTYTQGHGNQRTDIYAVQKDPSDSSMPTFGDAVVVASAAGASPVCAVSSNPSTRWHIWAKHVTNDGVKSTAPAGGTNGFIVTTGADVSTLLTALTGKIQQAQLFSVLGARIDLIDAVSGVAGSVNNRIAASAATLTSAYAAADATTLTSAQTYVASYAYSKSAVDGSFTSQYNALTANYQAADATTLSSAQAYVVTYSYSKASVDSSLSSLSTTLTAAYGTAISAAVATEASARAYKDGQLDLQWTVKLDANGYVSGFGLASTGPSASPTSAFIVRADSFSISSPSGPGITPITPFVVVTTATTINGMPVPVGVYMNAAFIENGTITNAKIGNAQIDDAKIVTLTAAKITAGSIAVGEYLQSTGYAAGSAGWRIAGNGVAEFAAASIRGQLTASQIAAGAIGATQIAAGAVDATKITVTNLSAVSAIIGTLRTTASGARVEIKDNKQGVFDSANVLRIRFGDLSGAF